MQILRLVISFIMGFIIFIKLPLLANSWMIAANGYPLFIKGQVYEAAFENTISIGDKFFWRNYDSSNNNLIDLRTKINKNFQTDNNQNALINLEKYLNEYISSQDERNKIKKLDPEALIYLNNACANLLTKTIYTIGVAIEKKSDNSRQILQGVAQAVNDINGGFSFDKDKKACDSNSNISIKIVLADSNIPPVVKLQSKILIQHPEVLAVIGYTTSSDATTAIRGKYPDGDNKKENINFKESQIPLILPTATRDNLINHEDRSYVYRLVPKNSLIAKAIVNKTLEKAGKNKFYIIHSSGEYSLDLFNRINQNENYNNVLKFDGNIEKQYEKVKDYILNNIADDNYDNHILILLPDSKSSKDVGNLEDAQTLTYNFLRELSKNQYKDNVLIFSADAFHNIAHDLKQGNLIDKLPEISTILPWDAKRYSNNLPEGENMEQSDEYLWGDGVGWRYAYANDSIVALYQIFNTIDNSAKRSQFDRFFPTRFHTITLRKTLKDKLDNFSLNNSDLHSNSKIMTGDRISFEKNERSEAENLIFEVTVE